MSIIRRVLFIIILMLFYSGCGHQSAIDQTGYSKDIQPDQAYNKLITLLGEGKQSEAEDLVELFVKQYPNDQRLAFFRAACKRSRFKVNTCK